jgi:hypothetical protein
MTSNEILTELRTKLARARELIETAFSRGTITRGLRDQYLNELTPEGDRATPVTITLNVTGAQNLSRVDMAQQVERVLAELAHLGGAQVVTGSVAVTLGGAPVAVAPTAPEVDDIDDIDDDEGTEEDDFEDEAGSELVRRQLTVSLEVSGVSPEFLAGNTAAEQRVQGALSNLASQYGITVGDVRLASTGGQWLRIDLNAQGGNGSLGRTAEVNVAVERALGALARNNGYEVRPGSVRVS